METTTTHRIAFALVVGMLGCGDDVAPLPDAARDATVDRLDAARDGAVDAPTDAPSDGASDAPADAEPDASPCATVDCSSLSDACNVGVCNPSDGTCARSPRSDGTVCDDGNACTIGDACTAGVCGGPARSCDDGNTCTTDSCDPTTGCRHVDASACVMAFCALPAGCGQDSDGDGLSDAWELAGGIDFNCDGVIEASERVLTNFDPLLPDGVTLNPHPSAEVDRKDVFVRWDSMAVAGSGNACASASDCALGEYCVGHCSTTTTTQCNTVANCPGGEGCVSRVCSGHDDAPSAAAMQMVIDAFSAHGINLHIWPVHNSVSHEMVTSYGAPVAGCAAPDAATLAMPGRAVDFYAVKPAQASVGGSQFPFIHYVVFGHHHTCDSAIDCASCPPNPETGNKPLFTETGLAELVGNDMLLAYGAFWDRFGGRFRPNDIQMAGTFMHELGHNLGLDHGGPISAQDHNVNFKPNYLSVMNYTFQSRGIGTASASCAPTDNVCKTTAISTRIDYSNSALPDLDENALDETVGIQDGNDITLYFCPLGTLGAGNGPIDWNCDGTIGTGIAAEINNDTSTEVLHGYADWPNLVFAFQCDTNGHFGDGAAAMSIPGGERGLDTAIRRGLLYAARWIGARLGEATSARTHP